MGGARIGKKQRGGIKKEDGEAQGAGQMEGESQKLHQNHNRGRQLEIRVT